MPLSTKEQQPNRAAIKPIWRERCRRHLWVRSLKRLDKYLAKRRAEDPLGFLFVMPDGAKVSLALIPIAREIFWGPMAYAMMGGIILGTMLTLLFLRTLRGVVPDQGAGARNGRRS